MKRILTLALILAAMPLSAKQYKLLSPNGEVSITIESGKTLSWSVSLGEEQLLAPSELSLTLEDGTVYGENTAWKRHAEKVLMRP